MTLDEARTLLGQANGAFEKAYQAMVAAQGKDGTTEACMAASQAVQRAQNVVARLEPRPSMTHASQWHHKRSRGR
jgi:hypothetical protein